MRARAYGGSHLGLLLLEDVAPTHLLRLICTAAWREHNPAETALTETAPD